MTLGALRTLCGVLACFVMLAGGWARAEAAPESRLESVVCVGVTVADLDRSVAWYTDVLEFSVERVEDGAGEDFERLTGIFGARCRTAVLRLGEERLELTEYLAAAGRRIPEGSRSHDRWFQHVAIVVSDMDRAYARLRERGVQHASTGPQTLPLSNPAAGGIRAFYLKDPDGHALELIQFPEGKGDPRWARMIADAGAAPLFLGIDHTAIVVGDTDASVRFYRDVLGLRIAGESENLGTEQEHLNNVFGARLRITTLKASAGPGVELLEYLAPSDGRPYPADARPCDIVHWQTCVRLKDIEGAASGARRAGGRWISAAKREGWPTIDAASWLVRDPDGHAVMLTETRTDRTGSPPSESSGGSTLSRPHRR